MLRVVSWMRARAQAHTHTHTHTHTECGAERRLMHKLGARLVRLEHSLKRQRPSTNTVYSYYRDDASDYMSALAMG